MTTATRFPLSWPAGRARTRYPSRARFKVQSFTRVRDELLHQFQTGARIVTDPTDLLPGEPMVAAASPAPTVWPPERPPEKAVRLLVGLLAWRFVKAGIHTAEPPNYRFLVPSDLLTLVADDGRCAVVRDTPRRMWRVPSDFLDRGA